MTEIKNNTSSSDISSMSSSCLTRGSRNKDIHSTGFPVKRGMTKDLESGRSMVEMLGVLAIVGVLSVGGIAGYTYAMNKHYANELLAGASERAVILKAQKAAGLDLSLREFDGMEVAGGEFSPDVLDADGSVGIAVSKVKGAVCKNLIQATEGTDIGIAQKADDNTLSDITEEECDDENDNDLVFVFETGLGGVSDSGANETVCDPACEGSQRCIQGVCVYSITDCPFEICDEDENCYLADVCSDICSEEYNETTGEYSYVCNTDEEDPPRCSYNSDCNDWCQEQDGDCFCDINGYNGEVSGSCALVDDYVDTARSGITGKPMTWVSGNNWCQAQGLIMASFSGEYDSSDVDEICDDALSYSDSDRLWVTINGKPANAECGYNIRFTMDPTQSTYSIPCVDPKTWNN